MVQGGSGQTGEDQSETGPGLLPPGEPGVVTLPGVPVSPGEPAEPQRW